MDTYTYTCRYDVCIYIQTCLVYILYIYTYVNRYA